MTIGNTNLTTQAYSPPAGSNPETSASGSSFNGRKAVVAPGQQLVSDFSGQVDMSSPLSDKSVTENVKTVGYIKSTPAENHTHTGCQNNLQNKGAKNITITLEGVFKGYSSDEEKEANTPVNSEPTKSTLVNNPTENKKRPVDNSPKESKGFLYKLGIIQSILNFFGRADLTEEKAISEICNNLKQELQGAIELCRSPLLTQQNDVIKAQKEKSNNIDEKHRQMSGTLGSLRPPVAKGFGFFAALRSMIPGLRPKHEPITEEKSAEYFRTSFTFYASEHAQTLQHEALTKAICTSRLIGGIFNTLSLYANEIVTNKENELRGRLHSRDPGFLIRNDEEKANYKSAIRVDLIKKLNSKFEEQLSEHKDKMNNDEYQVIKDFRFEMSQD